MFGIHAHLMIICLNFVLAPVCMNVGIDVLVIADESGSIGAAGFNVSWGFLPTSDGSVW